MDELLAVAIMNYGPRITKHLLSVCTNIDRHPLKMLNQQHMHSARLWETFKIVIKDPKTDYTIKNNFMSKCGLLNDNLESTKILFWEKTN